MKRWLIYGCIIAMVLPFLAFTVSAADANGNDWLDMDDYAEYYFSDDNTMVNIDCVFPTSWIETFLYDGSFSGSSFIHSYKGSPIVIDELVDDMYLFIRPNAGNVMSGPEIGTQLKNAHIIDLTVLPKKTSFTTSFYITVDVDVARADDFKGYQRLFFVDKDGKVVYKYNLSYRPKEIAYSGGMYVFAYEITTDLSSISLPDSVVGFIPCYELWEVYDNNLSYQIDSITYEPFSFFYSLSDLEYEYIENEKLQSTMVNVQNALADQAEQIGDLHDKVDQLPGQIGDQMQSVADNEKNEANSSGNGSVDQMTEIIPDYSTGLIEGVKKLASAISYEGTECKLKMPALTIPALTGVTPAPITFLDEQEVDLEVWFNRMPQKIMAVTRAMFDIAVVGFCFYELYDLISQLANGARKAEKVSK